MLLAGDIGGTKTNLAVFSPEARLRVPIVERTFPSAHYASLEELVEEFLSQVHLPIERASFGVAGPVVDGRATITNLPWVMKDTQLQEELHIPSVRLLNDLVATALAVPTLEPHDVHTLNEGEPYTQGSIAVIAPGTGLGEAFLTRNSTQYLAHPSEGGHADFAPSNPLEVELLDYLFTRFPHVSYERVCSGKGIPNIYNFLREGHHAEEPSWFAEQLTTVVDRTAHIVQNALNAEVACSICTETLNMFVSVLGAEAGNLALKVLATGGVYLGGGIPPRILSLLDRGQFMAAFRRKGRFTELLAHIPVHVILNPKVALLGAAQHALTVHS